VDRTFRILATPRSFCHTDGPHLSLLRERGCRVDLRAKEQPLGAEELRELIAGYDGAILGLDVCDASVLERATRLKVISRNGVGVDRIDVQAATERGIVVTNAPGANRVAVAELTLGLIFALARDLVRVACDAKRGIWRRGTGWELAGKTLGIVGLGAIGREVATRAHHLGMRVLGYDPNWPEDVEVARRVDLDTLLRESDVISLHAPLTPDTQGLLNRERLALMKDGSYLVNTARGGLVDEDALYGALASGKLAGAAMDAFSVEPPEKSPLLELDTFIPTPHIGANTRESSGRANLLAAQNLLAVWHGEPCPHIVNPEALEVRP
jgi:D-3-phosphoglycerate dehydrogenase